MAMNSRIHHRRPAKVVFAVFGREMIHKIVFVDDFMNEALIPRPVIFWLWIRQCRGPVEIIMLGLHAIKVFHVKHFPATAGAIPEGHLSFCVQALELIEYV